MDRSGVLLCLYLYVCIKEKNNMRKQCVTARVAVEVLSRELQSTMRASKIKSYVDGFFFLIYKIVNVQSDFCSYFRVFRAFSLYVKRTP